MAQGRTPITTLGTVRTFLGTGACSATACNVVNRAFGTPMPCEEHASEPLAGGIAQHGYQCGLIWGATLSAGAEAHRRFGPGPVAEAAAVFAAQRIVDAYRDHTGFIDCYDVTQADWRRKSGTMRFMLRGGPVKCFRLAPDISRKAYDAIEAALDAFSGEAPAPPVSCSAVLARKAGLSDLQATMAAGFAGGVGLSGSGCGALGAAVWIVGIREGEGSKLAYPDPRVDAVVERYLEASGYAFECAGVVGRRFESLADHASFVRGGGCAGILDALAAG